MGTPDSQLDYGFDRTNMILGASDPEYMPEGTDPLTGLLTAGGELAALMEGVAASKEGGDDEDLTSMLVNAELEDDQLTHGDLASFFILLVVRRAEVLDDGAGHGRLGVEMALWQTIQRPSAL